MAIARNLGEIRDLVNWIVDFDSTQTDQAFAGPTGDTNRHIDRAINLAYEEEVNSAMQNSSHEAFQFEHEFTWTASAATMKIPAAIRDFPILAIRDDTNTTRGGGAIVRLSERIGAIDGLYVIDRDTWGWYPTPSAAKTLRILYLAQATQMKQDMDEPHLIPAAHRALIAWSAAILLRDVADEQAPRSWVTKRMSMRASLAKELSKGRPIEYPPRRIRTSIQEATETF